jgi:hypothetical protein
MSLPEPLIIPWLVHIFELEDLFPHLLSVNWKMRGRIADIHPEQDHPRVIDRFEEPGRKEIEIARYIPVRRKDGGVSYADMSSSFLMLFGAQECLIEVYRDI